MMSQQSTTSGLTRKQRRRQKEQRALEERTDPIIPAATFNRIVDEVLQEYGNGSPIEAAARAALHEASEAHVNDMFVGAMKYAAHANRDTLLCRDIQAYRSRPT